LTENPPPLLQQISALTVEIRSLERDRQIAIHHAIHTGHSWAAVAGTLGVTAQAAHKRYRWLRHSTTTDEIWHEPPLPR
jgi:hypothetical protein